MSAAPPLHARALLRSVSLVLLALALGACTVGPNYVRPTPRVPAAWPSAALQPASAAPRSPAEAGLSSQPLPALSEVDSGPPQLLAWWGAFHDAQLDQLMRQALHANLDLRLAMLRTQEALSERDISALALWPTLSANASYDLEQLSTATPEGALLTAAPKFTIPGVGHITIPNPYNQFQLGASANWEFDLFGRLHRTLEAAAAQAQVSLEDQHAVQVSLLAQVAQNYIALRGAQARRAVAVEDLTTIQELLQLTEQRRASGLTTEVDVRNALAQLELTRATVPAMDLAITRAIHELGNLLGTEPETLRGQLTSAQPIPPVPPQVPIGLPAELVRRRPDVRQAEASLHAATAQIGVAIADLFPRLTLSGSGGFQSDTLGSLLHWGSLFGSVGPALEVPVLDRGAWRQVPLYRLRAREAALSYQSTVLTALHQVEDAVAAYQSDQQQRLWLTDTVAQNRVALELARQRYASGVSDFINVLDALRTLQQNQLSLLASSTAVSTDLVSLYQALGGGWQTGADSPGAGVGTNADRHAGL